MRGLLGPGRLAQRVADLEHTRALAVDDSAAMLRRLERNLHDGAQIRLATLAMNLGMAKEKLGEDGEVLDAAAVRELIDAAHRGAKDALSELRSLARGIHPPALDNGLRRRAGHARRGQRHPGGAGRGHPGPAQAGGRDDRLLLRGRAAGQRRQAQLRQQDQDPG